MTDLFWAVVTMGGLTLVFGIGIAIANRFLHIEEDSRIETVLALLPGSNCGACGEPGCRRFAQKLVLGEYSPGGCTVADAGMVETIADFLQVEVGELIKRVARLHCGGGTKHAQQMAEYRGFASCAAAALVAGGGKGCSWGCLGLADCQRVCDFDAIVMNDQGLPVVLAEQCTACGECVDVCPKQLFEMLPVTSSLLVQCQMPLSGENATALCQVACDACGRCAADAPGDLIQITRGLPVITAQNQVMLDKEAGLVAIKRCPTAAIVWLDGDQFDQPSPVNKSEEGRYDWLR